MLTATLRFLHRAIGRRFGRLAPQWLIERYREWTTDVYVVSFPKSGRTWFRTIIGNALQLHFGTRQVDPTSTHAMWMFHSRIPRITFTHDMDAHVKSVDAIAWSGGRYRRKPTIILIRDPRDTIVSLYFEMTKRVYLYEGTIADFIRGKDGGIDSLITFLNLWMGNLDRLDRKLVLTYEDLHHRPVDTIGRALRFAGVSAIGTETIAEALELSSFDRMRRMEQAGVVSHVRLRPGDPADLQSYKTRSGKIGGFRDHLTDEDIRYLDARINAGLDDALARYKYETPLEVSAA